MKLFSFFTDEFLDMKLSEKEIEQRKEDMKGDGFPEVDYYYEYKKLGGKEDRMEYFKMLDIFLEETMDIFVTGMMDKYDSREESLGGVMTILKISEDEVMELYHSVDNVTSYT